MPNSPDYAHLASRMHSVYLAKLLSKHLESVIKARISSITSSINKTIDELESELDAIWRAVAASPGRVALSTAANMCRKLPSDTLDFVMEAVPLLKNLLSYHDAKVLEHASVCLARIAEAFASSPEKLDELCNHGLVAQATGLVSVSNSVGQASLTKSTYTGVIHLLSTCGSGSPLAAKTLLLLGITGTLKDILSGSGLVSGTIVSPTLTRPADQRFALSTAANMCRKLPSEASDVVMEVIPLLTNLLTYHDAKVLEDASVCLALIAEAFASSPEKLDELSNHGLVAQAAGLVSVSNSVGQATPSTSTYTGVIRLLSTCGSGSPLAAADQINSPFERALSSLIPCNIRNTVSLSLNGSDSEVLLSYMLAITHLRFWNCSLGNVIDYNILFGREKILYTTPAAGSFHFIIKYKGRSIDLIIDAREGWLYGAVGAKGICLLCPDLGRANYITHQCTSLLNFDGQYDEIALGGVRQLPIGVPALRDAFDSLVEFDGITESPKLRLALGTLVFNICEAYKFHRVYELVCRTISRGGLTTVGDSSDPTIAEMVKKWGKFCGVANKDLFQVAYEGKERLDSQLLKKNLAGISSVENILENILIAPYSSIQYQYFKCRPRTFFSWCPVDVGDGDSEVSLLESFDYSSLLPLQHQKFLKDTEKYFGGRAGGRPHESVIDFIRRSSNPGMLDAWRLPLPVRNYGERLPNPKRIHHSNAFIRSTSWTAKLAKIPRYFKK